MSKISITKGNCLDEFEFDAIKGTDLCTKMIMNSVKVFYDISTPNVTMNAIDDFIHLNVSGLWHKRMSHRCAVYYFQQPTEKELVVNTMIDASK